MRVVAAVVVCDGRVLIDRRPAGVHQGGCWEFPGGKVEAGEGEPEALRRELREELAIEVDVGPLLLRVRHAYPDRGPVDLAFYLCRLRGAGPDGRGPAEPTWVLPTDLDRFRFPAANEAVVARLRTASSLEGVWDGGGLPAWDGGGLPIRPAPPA